jgi:hypothetical protein
MGLTSYIKSNAPITLRLCAVLFPVTLVSTLWNSYEQALVLWPCDPSLIRRGIGLLTHGVVISGLKQWLLISMMLTAAALVVERYVAAVHIIALWIAASVLGGMAFLALSESCVSFAGPASFVWAYTGAAVAAVCRTWKQTHWLEKLYLVLVGAGISGLFQEESAVFALQGTGFLLGAAGFWVMRARHDIRAAA